MIVAHNHVRTVAYNSWTKDLSTAQHRTVDGPFITLNRDFRPFSHLFCFTQPRSKGVFYIRLCSSLSSKIIGVAVNFAVKFSAVKKWLNPPPSSFYAQTLI